MSAASYVGQHRYLQCCFLHRRGSQRECFHASTSAALSLHHLLPAMVHAVCATAAATLPPFCLFLGTHLVQHHLLLSPFVVQLALLVHASFDLRDAERIRVRNFARIPAVGGGQLTADTRNRLDVDRSAALPLSVLLLDHRLDQVQGVRLTLQAGLRRQACQPSELEVAFLVLFVLFLLDKKNGGSSSILLLPVVQAVVDHRQG
mmetsp:Transcript_20945/g.59783  ORF Transcript_20945/g.59783 Transcript_20945/m.59783 type:complete len:204 (-) Transcript_20945:163-774(-)